jgi:AcrR family transcriptional regulator
VTAENEGESAVRPPRRADAERNLAAVVDAATVVFATAGVDVPAKEIADRAGVGVGTLYRHFPRRSDLVLAVLRRDLEDCVDAAAMLGASLAPDEALRAWIERFTRFVATKRGLAAALHSGDAAFDGLGHRLLGELEPSAAVLLAAATQSGAVRGDVNAIDLLRAVAHLCTPGPDGADFSRRMVAVLLDGLHTTRPQASGATQQSSPPQRGSTP